MLVDKVLTDRQLMQRFRESPMGQKMQAEVAAAALSERVALRKRIDEADANLSKALPDLNRRLEAAQAIAGTRAAELAKAEAAAIEIYGEQARAVATRDAVVSRGEKELRLTADARIRETADELTRLFERVRLGRFVLQPGQVGDKFTGVKHQDAHLARSDYEQRLADIAVIDAARHRVLALELSADPDILEQLAAIRAEAGLSPMRSLDLDAQPVAFGR